MENISQYIDVLVQAPIAVILIVFIYLTFKILTTFINTVLGQTNKIFSQLNETLKETIKIIKQIKRK